MAGEPRSGKAHKLTIRFGLTTIDQSIASVSNFAVGVAVARVAGIASFGAYALVYSIWLLIASFHRALVTDPMSIENDVHSSGVQRAVRVGLAAELWLGLASGVAFALAGIILLLLHQIQFGICFLGLAPWLPCLLAQDYWRWVGFMKAQPHKALANDVVFDVVQVGAFAALFFVGVRTSLLAVTAWGIGASCGALYGLRQHACRPSLGGGRERIKQRWGLSKWLLASNAASSATSQATLILSGAMLGPSALGGFKSAASLVSGFSMVLIQAGGNIGLPEASKAFRDRGWAGLRRVEHLITLTGMVSVGAVAVVIVLFGRRLLILVYGHAFARFAVEADILAVSLLIATIGLGPILGLKATRQTRRLLPVSVGSLALSVAAMATLAPLFGVLGAAFANLIDNTARTVWLLMTHARARRHIVEDPTPLPMRADLTPAIGDVAVGSVYVVHVMPPGWRRSATPSGYPAARPAATPRSAPVASWSGARRGTAE
jgi:O-antigen/teichoic acid export membrane protein